MITTTGTRCTSCFGPTIRTDSINYVTDSGRKATLRRSQVHPTVVYSALKSTLATSAMGLTPNDCFVQVGGGTPEGIVAAIMLGFQKVFYIGNEKERQWMSLPSKAVELASAVDYLNYTSPDPDFPEKGVLVVEAIKMLMPCIKSFVMEEIGSVMVPPPNLITVPPLQTFTFVQVTGRVIARTISTGSSAEQPSQSTPSLPSLKSSSPASAKAKAKASSGPGSSRGEQAPAAPKTKGKKVVVATEEVLEETQEEEELEENQEEEEDDMEALRKLQEAASSKKGRGRPAGSTGPAKKKAKTE